MMDKEEIIGHLRCTIIPSSYFMKLIECTFFPARLLMVPEYVGERRVREQEQALPTKNGHLGRGVWVAVRCSE